MTDNKRVLITGAASGLGHALARACAERGYRLAISDLDPGALDAGDPALAGAADILTLSLDVNREADFAAAVDETTSRFGGVDVLFNNAGVAGAGSVRATPLEEWQRMLDINLLGVVRGCRAVLPQMLDRGNGYIVNIASHPPDRRSRGGAIPTEKRRRPWPHCRRPCPGRWRWLRMRQCSRCSRCPDRASEATPPDSRARHPGD